jgi:hypothetical protein
MQAQNGLGRGAAASIARASPRLTIHSSRRLTARLNSNVRLRNTNAGSASVVVNAPSRAKCSAHVAVWQVTCEPGQALRRIAALLHLVNGWRFAPACCAAQSVVAWRRACATVAPARLASVARAAVCEAAAHAQESSPGVPQPLVHASSHGKFILQGCTGGHAVRGWRQGAGSAHGSRPAT